MDNIIELKSTLNLPFKININNNEYQLKILNITQIFELLEFINNIKLKDELKVQADILDLNDKGKKDLLIELKAKQDKVTFANFDEIFKALLANISIKDIISILSWAISIFNNKNQKDVAKELNDYVTTDNFSELMKYCLKILGINVDEDSTEEEVNDKIKKN